MRADAHFSSSRPDLNHPLLYSIACAFIVSVVAIKLILIFPTRASLMSKPDQRRRHERETPSIGGVGVLIGWLAGIFVYSQLTPGWSAENFQSYGVIITGVLVLHGLGLWDDLINIGPYTKLFVQSLVALLIINYEPNIHLLLTHWESTIGILSWVFGFLWIVGVTNSINLIDGIDGLAGGMSVVAGVSILVLLSWVGSYASNATIFVSLLLPALIAFLLFNWNPAKIFLGDNGSLPVGMLLSSASLMGYAQTNSWVMILSRVLIFGYPILDMAVCIFKRYQKRQAFFKGDRNHLHFRLMKLGLTTRQTAGLLLVIGVYLQIAAITVNLMPPPSATLGITLVFFSLFTLLFLVSSIEAWKVKKVFNSVQRENGRATEVLSPEIENRFHTPWRLVVDLAPLLEKSANPEKTKEGVLALQYLLKTLVRPEDLVFFGDTNVVIAFGDTNLNETLVENIRVRFQEKINQFMELFNVECATSMLPIEIRKHSQSTSL